MNWIKFNKIFKLAGVVAFILLAIARIMHFISFQTLLYSAGLLLFIASYLREKVRVILKKRIQELEER